jgi:hypothetical protein
VAGLVEFVVLAEVPGAVPVPQSRGEGVDEPEVAAAVEEQGAVPLVGDQCCRLCGAGDRARAALVVVDGALEAVM